MISKAATLIALSSSCALILSSCAGGTATSKTSQKGPLVIACVTPLSGSGAPIGDRLSAGAKFAVAHAPEIDGRKIELQVVDSKGDPATALQKVSQLAGDDSIVAVTCLGYSQEAAAVVGAIKSGRLSVPFVDNNNLSDDITGKLCNSWTFRIAPNNSGVTKAAENLIKETAGLGDKGWYLIGSDSAFGLGSIDSFKKLNLKTAGSSVASLDTTDWTPIINKAKASGADALWLPINFGTPLGQFLKQAHTLGLLGQAKGVLPIGLPFLDAIQELGSAGQGLMAPVFQDDLSIKSSAATVSSFNMDTGAPPSQQSLQQATATNVIIQAMKQASDKGAVSRKTLAQSLTNGEFDVSTGKLKFREGDHQGLFDVYQGTIEKLENPAYNVSYSWVPKRKIHTSDILPSATDLGCKP